jgi:hypothetical protein
MHVDYLRCVLPISVECRDSRSLFLEQTLSPFLEQAKKIPGAAGDL